MAARKSASAGGVAQPALGVCSGIIEMAAAAAWRKLGGVCGVAYGGENLLGETMAAGGGVMAQ
jgi:hypothetical protein